MRPAFMAAMVAAGAIASVAAAGCSRAPAEPRASVQSCTEFGVHAITHHTVVTKVPAGCQGLTKAQINFAVGKALYTVARSGQGKVAGRKRAAADSRYLAGLVTAVPAGTPGPVPGALRQPPARPEPHADRPMTVAALITWLATAALGGYLLAGWIRHGGLRRRDAGGGLPAPVILAHPALALTGLALWLIFLITGWTATAWAALAVLLPVLGLGMAVLAAGHGGDEGEVPPGAARAGSGAAAVPGPAPAAAAPDAGVVVAEGLVTRARWPLVTAVHGVLAAATVLLVLLAALGAR